MSGNKKSGAKKKTSKKKAKTTTKKKTASKKATASTKKATTKKKAVSASKASGAATKKKATKKKAAKKAPAPAQDPELELEEDEGEVERNGKALVVVESPAKAKTINKFLGGGYHVMASMGHVRDLPKNQLGIDTEHGFEPIYEPLPDKKKVIAELRKHARGASTVYLACDMDREGEAIAWHIAELLKGKRDRIRRVTFNQITKAAIEKAFQAPRDLDMNKVYAQQARRILDRIVGYKLSQLLWKKVRRGLSAGRVQSVAVKMVVEREKEIREFDPVEYWEIGALFDSPRLRGGEAAAPAPSEGDDADLPGYRFRANLVRLGGEKLDPDGFRIENEDQAREWESKLNAATWAISKVEQKERRNNPKPPFITSTLQQAASSELGFAAKRTMRIAQQLYEGVEVGGEGVGLITYMRTDSFNLASEAVEEAREHVRGAFGDEYVPETPNAYRRGKMKVQAQEAHEAIRPTAVERTPDAIKGFLTDEQLKLYTLIWRRFVASQMPPARFMAMTVEASAAVSSGEEAVFRASGQRLLFDGHLRVSGAPRQGDRLLPDLQEGEALDLVPPLATNQKFTSPPPRYNEASLVKRLEAEGIGRPSTYATIISTIQDRGYVEQKSRALYATTKGEVVTRKLGQFFDEIMDYGYTRQMEENLDRVEGALEADEGEEGDTLPVLDWRELLTGFYHEFSEDLERAKSEMKHVNEDPEESSFACPECGSKMQKMYNTKEFTQFLGCSRYPECKTTVPLGDDGQPLPEEEVDERCPKCEKPLVIKSGRRGRFFACSGYPECKQTFEVGEDGRPVPPPDVEADCPECGEAMIVRKGRRGPFLGCPRYPKCRGTLPIIKNEDGTWSVGEKGQRQEMPKVDIKCERCGSPMAIKRSGRGPFLGCTAYPKCRATAKLPEDIELPKKPEPKPYGEDCELCGKPLVIREGRRGPFVACSGYPGCKNTRNVPA